MEQKFTVFATLAVCALAACTEDPPVTVTTPVEDWTAQPEYEIGDQMEGDALFGRVQGVRPAADGSRVYVLDAQTGDVTIWTPEGTLIERVGRRGQGPGEFSDPTLLFLFDDRFQVGDNARLRYSTFTRDGEFVRTDAFRSVVGPFTSIRTQTRFQSFAMFADGSVGALGLPLWLGSGTVPDGSAAAVAVLRASQDEGAWGLDTLGLLSFQDVYTSLSGRGGSMRILQPWVRPDHFAIDPGNGSVVISRSLRLRTRVLELIEISTSGDTLWTRQVHLPPLPVTRDDIDEAVDQWAPFVAGNSGDTTASPGLKRRIRDAFIIPDHWPAAHEIQLMSNGEVWFQSVGDEDPGVWYAVRKGEEGPMRRITVPESFTPGDVNATHVWGIRRDALDVQYVAGLRLARAGG